MQVKFYLAGAKRNRVMMRCNCKSHSMRRWIDIMVDPSYWSAERMRCVNPIRYPLGRDINARLDEIQRQMITRYSDYVLKTGRQPTANDMNAMYEQEAPKELTIDHYGDQYVQSLKRRTNQRTGVVIARVTWQKQANTVALLREFQRDIRQVYRLEDCTLVFYNRFSQWLVSREYSLNYVGKVLSIVRSWLRQADADGHQVSRAYLSPDWRISRDRVSHVSLSEAELTAMLDLPLSGGMELTRDLFILAAYTGLRYSDLSRLDTAIIQDGIIRMDQQKTLGEVVIPVHPVVKGILDKYAGRGSRVPAAISNVRMNLYLKEIGQMAGICDAVFRRITRGGRREQTRVEKWELITTHTARRSFAKNLYTSGFPVDYLMRIMGHRKPEQTLEYIGLDAMEKAQLLAKHWRVSAV